MKIVQVELTEYLIRSDFTGGNSLPLPEATKQALLAKLHAGKRLVIEYPIYTREETNKK